MGNSTSAENDGDGRWSGKAQTVDFHYYGIGGVAALHCLTKGWMVISKGTRSEMI